MVSGFSQMYKFKKQTAAVAAVFILHSAVIENP
jgi:hypothetical protein